MRIPRPTLLLLLLLASSTLPAQFRERDPLTKQEAADLADVKQEPEKRLDLFVKYARIRLSSVEQTRNDPKAQDRGQKLHDLLEDFTTIVDEMSDNIDDYSDKRDDIRKPLKKVIDADTEFQIRLKNFKQASATPASASSAPANDASDYTFALQNAIEAVNANADDARKILEDQERIVKEAKEAEKLKKKKQ